MFLLLHSPLVGRSTWLPVAEALRRRGVEATVPTLPDVAAGGAPPTWRAHAVAVAASLAAAGDDRIVVVAHSGAGPMLPAVGAALAERGFVPAAYLFVDAGIPAEGSRLDLLRAELPEMAEALHRHLAAGGAYPAWSDAELRGILPDADTRAVVLAEMRPQPLAFWVEPLPPLGRWPDAPCAYLQFSDGYAVPAATARRRAWPVRRVHGGHFHMLVDPQDVADAILILSNGLGSSPDDTR